MPADIEPTADVHELPAIKSGDGYTAEYAHGLGATPVRQQKHDLCGGRPRTGHEITASDIGDAPSDLTPPGPQGSHAPQFGHEIRISGTFGDRGKFFHGRAFRASGGGLNGLFLLFEFGHFEYTLQQRIHDLEYF